MKINLPTKYSQNDSQWRNYPLGNMTIGQIGCLITDVCNICNLYGHTITPPQLVDWLRNNDGLSGNFFKWDSIPRLYSDIKLGNVVGGIVDPLTKAQMDAIRAKIDAGMPVLLQIDTIPATSTLDEHWVTAIDYDGDDLWVHDPWDGQTKRITSWGVRPQELIYAYAWYTGKAIEQSTTITIDSKLYEKLVGNSTKWDNVCTYLEISGDPASTSFEDMQRVVAGYKSRVTDLQTQLTQASGELENRTQQVSRLKDDLLQSEKLRKELSDSLNEAIKKVSGIQKVYEDQLAVEKGKQETLAKEKGALIIEIGKLKTKNEELMKNSIDSLTVADVLVLLFNKLKQVKLK